MNELEKKQLRNVLAKRLKTVREQKGLSQHDVAQAMDLSQSIISKYEAALTDITLDVLLRYADVFGCSVDYLLDRNSCFDLTTYKGILFAAFEKLTPNEQKVVSHLVAGFASVRI